MRRLQFALAVLALAAPACGGSAGTSTTNVSTTLPATTTTTEPPSVEITSDDGAVTLLVPPGAAEAAITITALDPTEHPDGPLEATRLYELTPDGYTFDAPGIVSIEIPLSDIGDFAGGQVPLLSMVSTTDDGEGWELVADQRLTRVGDTVVVSGEITHFSSLAALYENVIIDVRFLEVSRSSTEDLAIDLTGLGADDRVMTTRFYWSNGVPLVAPEFGSARYASNDTVLPVHPIANGLVIGCPPTAGTLSGYLEFELLLGATEDTSGETGLTSAPALVGTNAQASIVVAGGLQLLCRPTIGEDGTVSLSLQLDHPGGEAFVPNEDFGGGASGLVGSLDRAIPGLLAGVIRDEDSNGAIGPHDTMYAPVITTISDDGTTFVIPLFGFGDYFMYFIDTRDIGAVQLPSGSTTVIGGLTDLHESGVPLDRIAVPWLGDVPFVGELFADETRTDDDVELVILVTPTVIEPDE
jgi:hypothetical protein